MTSFKPGTRLQLEIERLSIGGRGVARHEGLVIFVADVAPGEKVEAELTKVKKNFAEARLVQIIEASADRVSPPCPYVGVCGGCSWQHLSSLRQLEEKRALVIEALRKFSGFGIPDALVAATVPSPREFRYRNRVQVHVEKGKVGFHQRGSNRLVEIDDCLIADERLITLLREFKDTLPGKNQPTRVELFLDEKGEAAIRSTADRGADLDDEAAFSQFSQVNSEQNENLVRHVLERLRTAATHVPIERIYDLYAGNGNFTLPIAREFPSAEIASAELNARNVRRAREQAVREFPGRKLRIEEADVGQFIQGEKAMSDSVVLLDPPRTGCMPEVMQTLSVAAPRTIVYISCHPVTLARDLKYFSPTVYRIDSVTPFDMFSQTDHVETVVVMNRLDISRSG